MCLRWHLRHPDRQAEGAPEGRRRPLRWPPPDWEGTEPRLLTGATLRPNSEISTGNWRIKDTAKAPANSSE